MLTVTQGRAVCADLRMRVESPALARAAHEALLDAALALTPRAELAPRSGGAQGHEAAVYADASGSDSLFRSEAGFAAALEVQAHKLGLPAMVAVAASRSVCHLVARSLARRSGGREATTCVVPPGAEAAWLAPLPVDLLDPDDSLADSLTRLGIHTVRELLALPRRSLAGRLGPGAVALAALVRGDCQEPGLPVPEPSRLIEAVDLEWPVDRIEPLGFALQGLLSRLLARLEARSLGCSELAVHLDLDGGGRDARRVALATPSSDLRIWMRCLFRALEQLPPEAPVVAARIEAEGSPVRLDQLDLFRPAGPAPSALSRTLAELESLCGRDRVGAPEVADDHRPDAFALAPFAPGPAAGPADCAREASARHGLHFAVRALRPPVPASVRVADGRPAWIQSAVARGRVVQLAGPWRTTGRWWSRAERFAFDHFDVQTSDGTIARLRFDHLTRCWAFDAVYD
jgi:protein ImuB